MAKLYNLARMTTATTGTGTITLGSAVSSYVTFANAGVQNGDTVTYAIVDGSNREVGRGVYTSSGTTLTRATILESTNSNNAINLSGSAEVFITAAAEDIANVGETNTFTSSQVISVTDNSNAALRVTQLGTGNAILVEDETNPDSSPFVVKADGKVGVGTTTPNVQLEVNGSIRTSSTVPAVEIYENDAATNSKHWWFRAEGGILALQALDDAGGGGGALVQYTRSGNALQTMQGWRAGSVRYELSNWDSHLLFSNADAATGTATSNNFILRTNNTERFRVGTAGQWGIGGATYGTAGQAFVSGGASAAPSWSTLGVAGGGTGVTSATAYAVITGGTTSTGAFQTVSGLGTSGQVLTSNGTGALPSWQAVPASGMTLLGTITTTSGTNPTLTGLTLTGYDQLVLVFNGVSHDNASSRNLMLGTSTADDIEITEAFGSGGVGFNGMVWVDLNAGIFFSGAGGSNNNPATGGNYYRGDTAITTASTVVSLALSGPGNFDAGSVRVYGVA